MNRHTLLISVAATTVLLLGLAAGLATAQAPDGRAWGGASLAASALGTGFTYQGQVIKDGTPANGACDFRFTLYDAASGGTQVGSTITVKGVTVTGGLFTIPNLDFGSGIFAGERRWLAVAVRCPADTGSYVTVGDPQELTAAPYALYAAGNWSLSGNAGTTAGMNYLGTSDNQALELKVNGQRALRIEPDATSPKLIGGSISNTVSGGIWGATIGGGGFPSADCGLFHDQPCWNQVSGYWGTIGGGMANTVSDYATVAGGAENRANGYGATIAGGQYNTASGTGATVGGGGSNFASGHYATIGGGAENLASGTHSTVSGGGYNTASGDYSFAAGYRAQATNSGSFVWADTTEANFTSVADDAFAVRATGGVTMVVGSGAWRIEPHATSPKLIGGFVSNTVSAGIYGASIGGGGMAGETCGTSLDQPCWNRVTGSLGTVGGGSANTAGGDATVGGGCGNIAGGLAGAIGGGCNNSANGMSATVGGGMNNHASGYRGTVGGGYTNVASGEQAIVGGGRLNDATGMDATIGGGYDNTASGTSSTVGGGASNIAAGDYSFAAGYRAKANHQGSFVWGDAWEADIASSADNQFVIRANGGVKVVRGQNTFASTNAALQVEQADTSGQAIYATSAGTLQDGATAYLEATNTGGGIALWGTAQGSDTTVLLEHSANAGQFVKFYQTNPSDLRFKVDWAGNVTADGTYSSPAADFAELLPAAAGLAAGDVLIIGPDGQLALSREPFAAAVVGVYSAQPGFLGGATDAAVAGQVPLAIAGVVPTKVSAENGAIRPGDLLTTAATAGHAMRCEGVARCFGRTLGKALQGLSAGTGVIKVLVMLQ